MNGWNVPTMYSTNPCDDLLKENTMESVTVSHIPVAEHEAVIADKDETIHNLNTRINNQRDSFYQLQREFDKYKTSVRDAIVAVHEDGDLDERETTELLDTLGLDGLKRNYTVQVTLSHTVEIEVEATSEDDAQEKVDGMDVDEILEQSGACIDYFDINVDNAWEA